MSDLKSKTSELKRFMQGAPKKAGVILVEEFNQNFKRQGYVNKGGVFVPWKPRRSEARVRFGTTGKRNLSRKSKESRAILVQSGNMKRDIRIKSATHDTVTIVNTMPYAKRHNDGLNGMHKRPFMVESKQATDRIRKMIVDNVNKIFK